MKFGIGNKNANLSLNAESFVATLSISGDMTSQISHFYEGTHQGDPTFTPWKWEVCQ